MTMGAPALKLSLDEDSSLIEGDETTEEEIADMDAFWAKVDPEGHALMMGKTMKGAFGRLSMSGATFEFPSTLRRKNGRWVQI